MAMREPVRVDPDVGIPDLIKRLTDDTKRLMGDEVRLAKLETRESVKQGGKGALWMALAFGVSIVMLVALTVLLVTLIGRIASGHMWVGAIVTGIIELVAAFVLIKKGLGKFREPSYSLEETRAELSETARWAKHPRSGHIPNATVLPS